MDAIPCFPDGHCEHADPLLPYVPISQKQSYIDIVLGLETANRGQGKQLLDGDDEVLRQPPVELYEFAGHFSQSRQTLSVYS
jgi:hypothetical protein